ncbi:MAG TPA: hypothetical protein PL110_03975 [Candidatus Eremiobacteraeota bacterium]|nr:MAG: hypothetical protein BWY64_02054 [bacterium ADurb.Bin363]HPZ07245.1 hypothetical protein [Candidatus Eremiobacteraeota bacterium]
MGLILSLQEEGIAAKWMMLVGIGVVVLSIITEVILTFLRGSMNAIALLDLPTMIWYFGLFLILIGLLLMLKNMVFPPGENKRVEENFKAKALIFTGILCLIITVILNFIKHTFKDGCFTGIIAFHLSLSIPRLGILIGIAIFLAGLLMSIKYLMGCMLKIIWPFKKKR